MLYVYNKTASPVTLAAGNPVRVIPASAAPPARGPAVDVTSELLGLSGPNYTALQAQVTAGDLEFQWSSSPEYSVGALVVGGPTPGTHSHAHTDLTGVTATQHHTNANDPTADQKAALAGTSGSPSVSNKYATEADPRFKRETILLQVVGAVSAATEQGGVWFPQAAGAITAVSAYRKSTTGTGAATVIDIHVGGTTIFTTQSNRPSIAFDDADGYAVSGTIEAGTFTAGQKISMDVDSIDSGGAPSDLTVQLTVEYSA